LSFEDWGLAETWFDLWCGARKQDIRLERQRIWLGRGSDIPSIGVCASSQKLQLCHWRNRTSRPRPMVLVRVVLFSWVRARSRIKNVGYCERLPFPPAPFVPGNRLPNANRGHKTKKHKEACLIKEHERTEENRLAYLRFSSAVLGLVLPSLLPFLTSLSATFRCWACSTRRSPSRSYPWSAWKRLGPLLWCLKLFLNLIFFPGVAWVLGLVGLCERESGCGCRGAGDKCGCGLVER
jgi:hypothetical protein